jgi:hypothetical protein
VWKAAAAGGDPDPERRLWLVLADAAGAGDALAELLRTRGDRGVRVARGEHFARLGRDAFSVAPDEVADFTRVLAEVGEQPARVVQLWALDVAAAPDDFDRARSLACLSTLHLVRALAAEGALDADLAVVTRGAQRVSGLQSRVVAGGAPAWGLAKALGFEIPELAPRCIDLDPDSDLSPGLLLHELLHPRRELQVAFRGTQRFVPRLRRVALRLDPIAMDPDAWYVVSGAAGSLGPDLVDSLVERGARHVIALVRSEPSPSARARLVAPRASGASVRIAQVDCARSAELGPILGALRAERHIAGVVHLAGASDDTPCLELDATRFRDGTAPRIEAAARLSAETEGDALDFFVAFSSAVAVLGAPEQAVVAAGAAFLDALCHDRVARGLPGLSLDWSPWAEEDAEASAGEDAAVDGSFFRRVPRDAGLRLLWEIAAARGQLAIFPFALPDLLRVLPPGVAVATIPEDSDAPAEARGYERDRIDAPFVAPEGPVEQGIAHLWRRALSLDRVGATDDFFELGGDSVLAGLVLDRVGQRYGIELTLQDTFDDFRVRTLARVVEERLARRVAALSDADAEAALAQLAGPHAP